MTLNPLAHFRPLLDGFTVIMIDENVFRPIFFPFIHLNSSNFTIFSMKSFSRSYLIYVGEFRRVFHSTLELFSTFSKIFFPFFLINAQIIKRNRFFRRFKHKFAN